MGITRTLPDKDETEVLYSSVRDPLGPCSLFLGIRQRGSIAGLTLMSEGIFGAALRAGFQYIPLPTTVYPPSLLLHILFSSFYIRQS